MIISHCPEAERAAAEVVSLPVHPYLTDSEIEEVAGAVSGLARGNKAAAN